MHLSSRSADCPHPPPAPGPESCALGPSPACALCGPPALPWLIPGWLPSGLSAKRVLAPLTLSPNTSFQASGHSREGWEAMLGRSPAPAESGQSPACGCPWERLDAGRVHTRPCAQNSPGLHVERNYETK